MKFFNCWRRYFGWFPIQFCVMCNCPYWGGLPKPEWLFGAERQWMPWWSDYCSQSCCHADQEIQEIPSEIDVL